MSFLLILKLATVVFFLVMFLRGARLVWGVGLLTVTSAVLLDTLLGTVGPERLAAELGFFFYVIGGALFAGGAFWLRGLLRPTGQGLARPAAAQPIVRRPVAAPRPVWTEALPDSTGTAYDRQMLYDQVRQRFSPEDVLDLIFDLGMNENDVIGLNQDMSQVIINVIDLAEERGQSSTLALAVERILTPLPSDHLPRLEKISVESPPIVLRQYLLSSYGLGDLAAMAEELGIDWEQISGAGKKEKVRNLLLFLYRRNRVNAFIDLMKQPAGS